MNQERLLKIILSPHLSEKATIATQERREYVFEVCGTATKPEIKNAVEDLFKTKVDLVRIVNVKTKPKRFGAIQGRSKKWKKAYVTLQSGQQIDLAGTQ
ncbi:MAG: 50S ribosomal protein L23 [Gammaproteobacteria bacterium]